MHLLIYALIGNKFSISTANSLHSTLKKKRQYTTQKSIISNLFREGDLIAQSRGDFYLLHCS